MVCDTHHSLRHILKSDLFSSQNDSTLSNLGNGDDLEHSLSSIFDQKFITLIPINPQLAFINWYIDEQTAFSLKKELGAIYQNSSLIIRIYDVTEVKFNGFNARNQVDIQIDRLSGCHYQKIDQIGCFLMAEVGFRCSDTRFFPCARSNTMYFRGPIDTSPSLYISHGFNRFYKITHKANHQSEKDMSTPAVNSSIKDRLSVAVFLNENIAFNNNQSDRILSTSLRIVLDYFQQTNIFTHLFTSMFSAHNRNQSKSIVDFAFETSMLSLDKFYEIHRKNPFNCIQSHNWYSAPAAMLAASANHLPFISVCHSLELERRSLLPVAQSQQIEFWERKSILKADMVVVSKESTRNLIIQHYGKSEENVAVLGDLSANSVTNTEKAKRLPFNLTSDHPILLFAGEFTDFCGVDLIIESLPNVCREFPFVNFVFAGEGELRTAFEYRANLLGVGRNCCFTGHLDAIVFDQLFDAAFALIVPFRRKYQAELLKRAVDSGLTILTTHQAAIGTIQHGLNGLLVYDNPGSVCWGIKEILSKPRKIRSMIQTNTVKAIASMYRSIWMNLALPGKEV